MVFDTDDVHEGHDRMDLLMRLKEANPDFRMTAFVIPALCSDAYLVSLPEWIDVALHGWAHPHAREAKNWSYEQALDVLITAQNRPRFVKLWRAPGWQISDGTYQACLDLGWAVADQSYNDWRRPAGIAYHCEGEFDHVHTHVQDWGSNGLNEMWPTLLNRVTAASSFETVLEVCRPWQPVAVAA